MAKGVKHAGGRRTSHFPFKKRCECMGCKKRAKYLVNEKYFCKYHWDS